MCSWKVNTLRLLLARTSQAVRQGDRAQGFAHVLSLARAINKKIPEHPSRVEGTAVESFCIEYLFMDTEKTIAEIEWLERIFGMPDTRCIRTADREAVNQQHDRALAANPWFRLWQRYGICTRM